MAGRLTYYAEDTSRTTTTSTSYQDKVTLNWTPDSTDDHWCLWSGVFDQTDGTYDVKTKFINDSATLDYSIINVEAKDVTDKWTFFGMKRYQPPDTSAKTFKIQYCTENAASTVGSDDCALVVIKSNSADQYAESEADSTTTSASYSTKTTLTFTPATTGDYLIIATAEMNINSTSNAYGVRLVHSGTNYGHTTCANDDANTYRPWGTVVKLNLANSSQTLTIQYNAAGSSTATIRRARILAIRLDTLDNAYYGESRTRAATTSTSFSDKATVTQTPLNKKHVILGCGLADGSSTSVSSYVRFLEGATTLADIVQETNLAANEYPFLYVYQKTLAASSTTWKTQYSTEGAANSCGFSESAIAIIQTESDSNVVISADPRSVAVSEQTALVYASRIVSADPDSVSVTEQTANVLVNPVVAADPRSVAVTEQTALVYANRIISADPDTVAVTEQTALVYANRIITADPGSVSVSEQSAIIGLTVPASPYSGNYDGSSNTLVYASRFVSADPDSVVVTGQTATALVNRVVLADPGSVNTEGVSGTLVYANKIVAADPDAVAVTEQTALVYASRFVAADPDAITITGQSATASVQEGNITITADPDAVAVTEQTAVIALSIPATEKAVNAEGVTGSLVYASRVISADPSSVSVDGASSIIGLSVQASPDAVDVTEQTALVYASRVISADPDTVAITEQTAEAIVSIVVFSNPGNVVVTEQTATVFTDKIVSATPGTVDSAGQSSIIGVSIGASPDGVSVSEQSAIISLTVPAQPDSIAATEQTANVFASRFVAADPDSVSITGQTANVITNRVIQASPGGVTISEQTANVFANKIIAATPDTVAVSGASATVVVVTGGATIIAMPRTVDVSGKVAYLRNPAFAYQETSRQVVNGFSKVVQNTQQRSVGNSYNRNIRNQW